MRYNNHKIKRIVNRAGLKISIFLAVFTVFLLAHRISFSQENSSSTPVDSDFLLPAQLNLCGEEMPLSDQWVWEMLDRELTFMAWNKAQVFMWLKRAGRYFPYIEKKLAQEDMPEDIKYLVIAESSLLARTRSSCGAMGFWQFMPETAKQNGLRADHRIDERSDFEHSTDAALKHLKKLKGILGTWTLSMAAFNCGDQRLKKTMEEQRQTDFYNLKLPDETERYIYKIAAIKLIMENPETYGYHLPEEKKYKPLQCDTVRVHVEKTIHITDLAEAFGTSLKVIRDLNPQITGNLLPTGSFALKTPAGTGSEVAAVLVSLSQKARSYSSDKFYSATYKVKPGDTLSGISKKTGVPVSHIKKKNNLKGSAIKAGQVLYFD